MEKPILRKRPPHKCVACQDHGKCTDHYEVFVSIVVEVSILQPKGISNNPSATHRTKLQVSSDNISIKVCQNNERVSWIIGSQCFVPSFRPTVKRTSSKIASTSLHQRSPLLRQVRLMRCATPLTRATSPMVVPTCPRLNQRSVLTRRARNTFVQTFVSFVVHQKNGERFRSPKGLQVC
jgi:hypothetical protein